MKVSPQSLCLGATCTVVCNRIKLSQKVSSKYFAIASLGKKLGQSKVGGLQRGGFRKHGVGLLTSSATSSNFFVFVYLPLGCSTNTVTK